MCTSTFYLEINLPSITPWQAMFSYVMCVQGATQSSFVQKVLEIPKPEFQLPRPPFCLFLPHLVGFKAIVTWLDVGRDRAG